MEQAIVTSESGITKRTYVLLTLNILGAIGCVVTTIVLILWAQLLILREPNVCPVIKNYISMYRNKSTRIAVDNVFFDIDNLWDDTAPIE